MSRSAASGPKVPPAVELTENSIRQSAPERSDFTTWQPGSWQMRAGIASQRWKLSLRTTKWARWRRRRWSRSGGETAGHPQIGR